jgi:hypothetical protein
MRVKPILLVWPTLFLNLAWAGSLQVNGLCEVGNCATPDTLAANATVTDPFSFVYTLPDTDRFRIQGELVASDTDGLCWSLLGSQFTATYLGNSSRTASAETFSRSISCRISSTIRLFQTLPKCSTGVSAGRWHFLERAGASRDF